MDAAAPGAQQVYFAYPWSEEEQRRYEDMARRVIDLVVAAPEISSVVNKFRLTRDPREDRRQRLALEEALKPRLGELQLPVNYESLGCVLDVAYDELLGLGPLGPAWRDDDVTDIFVDGWDRIYVERDGRLVPTTARFRDQAHASSIARGLARMVSDRALSPSNPMVDAQLDGARANFVYSPVAANGLAISLRKHRPLLGMGGLVRNGSLTSEMAEFLRDTVMARATVLVSGGTGVGKTTMINALSEFIPGSERVITIEDALELKLANRFVVSLQTKERASADDEALVDQQELLKNSLRMRPDRIIVGEIREPDAAALMLQAANTGHEGTMTTIHANNADSALNTRLANLVRSGSRVPDDVAKLQIAEAFDLVVQGSRRHGRRFIEEVAEVVVGDLERTGRLAPRAVFHGRVGSDGNVVHERVGGIEPKGLLAERMLEAGIDPQRWA